MTRKLEVFILTVFLAGMGSDFVRPEPGLKRCQRTTRRLTSLLTHDTCAREGTSNTSKTLPNHSVSRGKLIFARAMPGGNCRIRFDFAGSASGISVWDQIPFGRISVVGSDSSGTVGMVGMVGMVGTVGMVVIAGAQPVSNNSWNSLYSTSPNQRYSYGLASTI